MTDTRIVFRDGVELEISRVSDDEFIGRYFDHGSSWSAAYSEATLADIWDHIKRDVLS